MIKRVCINIATYPKRRALLPRSIERLMPQADVLRVVLNEFTEIPPEWSGLGPVDWIIPDQDYKDVGKFVPASRPDDIVILCDDDIDYPTNYVEYLLAAHKELDPLNPILGLHGIIYADFFDGDAGSRTDYTFNTELAAHMLVNQLGTGTVMLQGWQMPSLDFMMGSQRFVDLRFAIHAHRHRFPMIAVKRAQSWLPSITTNESLFSSFTRSWPADVTREAQEIAGFAKLDIVAQFQLSKLIAAPEA